MAQFENVIFGDEELHKTIQSYSKKRGITFSRAVQELSAGGLLLYKETDNIPPFTSMEKIKKIENFIESCRKESE
jgi:hypothetical protein